MRRSKVKRICGKTPLPKGSGVLPQIGAGGRRGMGRREDRLYLEEMPGCTGPLRLVCT